VRPKNNKSGQVANCLHIINPKINQYGLLFISFFSESVLDDTVLSKLILVGKGVFFGVTCSKLKQLI
jgi:hypothetical protein